MSHATAPIPVLPITCSLLSCSEQSFGAAPMDTAALDNGLCPTNLCYKSNTIVTNLSSIFSICFLDVYLVCHGGELHNQTSSATMDMCTDVRKYAFPNPCLLDFFSCFGVYYHLSKYSTLSNTLYIPYI